ncbi:MAG TPA: hypothetical protein VLW46_00910 [Candidatus Bathyarchaeia archaeon]|nr:hypothetical protein [Candidatus Bathyarchaeia archaeon]
MKRHVAGESARKISREEGRDRETITKIVKSEDMAALVRSLREQLYGMAGQALQTVLEGMTERKNELLAYKLLADIGVIPTAGERMQLQSTPAVRDENQGFKDQVKKIAQIMFERMETYGTRFDEVGVRLNSETGQVESVDGDPKKE